MEDITLKCAGCSEACEAVVRERFEFLRSFFEFELKDTMSQCVTVTIINSLEDFHERYKNENGKEPMSYVVGFAGKDGNIFVLSKELFSAKGHKKEEFERVITHELCHIFMRRILNPKKTYVWIEEGICQFLSFGDQPAKVRHPIDFSKIRAREQWNTYNAYSQSSAFFKYLTKKRGINSIGRFLNLLRSTSEENAFKEVYGDFGQQEKEFFDSLKNEEPSPSSNTL
jgi:hypothetical protein